MNSATTTEPRRGRKYDQVIAGALQIFLRDGFEGASVDDIARAAGVSKATLYAYFPDKRVMFLEACLNECRKQASDIDEKVRPDHSTETTLRVILYNIIELMMSDFGRRMYRLIVAEVARFPELAREFYYNGLEPMRHHMVTHLLRMQGEGRLVVPDPVLASEQLVQLCKANLFERMVLGLVEDILPEEIDRTVASAVEVFLAAYGVKETS